MILGDGFLADGAREAFGDVPWTWVLDHPTLEPLEPRIGDSGIVVISTPIHIGTIATLEGIFPDHKFAYVPENVRQAHPEDWLNQDRFVVGARDFHVQFLIGKHLQPALFMSPESAEMVKHALNGFLAMSIEYARDIARLATENGAVPADVARGLMSDERIGERAYLNPEGEIGPNLAREITVLVNLGLWA